MNISQLLNKLSKFTTDLYLVDKSLNILEKFPKDKLLPLEIDKEQLQSLITLLDKEKLIRISKTSLHAGLALSNDNYLIASLDILTISSNVELIESKYLSINTLLECIHDFDTEDNKENQKIDEKPLLDFLDSIKKDITISTPSLDSVLLKDTQHNTYSYELAHLGAIIEGDPQKALRALRSPMHGKEGKMGFTPLRHAKNSAIIHATLAARAAIKGGIPVEAAYTIADFFILTAEKAKTPEEAFLLREAISYKFAQLVYEHSSKKTHSYRSNVVKILQEIERKIFTKCTREEIVTAAALNVDYAERIFKEDVGFTIMDYLRNQRVEKAKDLLLNSSLKVGDIAYLLQFSSTSHFARVFKKVTTLSPLEYKEKNFIKTQTATATSNQI